MAHSKPSFSDPDFEKATQLHQTIVTKLKESLTAHEILLQILQEIVTAIKESYNKSRKAKIAGGTAGIVGSGLGILGFALIPVTFGGSIALTIIGGGIGAAGGLTAAGADVGYYIVSKEREKTAEEVWAKYQEKIKELNELVENYQSLLSELSERHQVAEENLFQKIKRKLDKPAVAGAVGKFMYSSFKAGDLITDTVTVVKGIGAGARAGFTAFKIVGVVADVATLPLDLFVLVKGSYDVYKYEQEGKSNSTRAMTVEKKIEELKDHRDKLIKVLEALDK